MECARLQRFGRSFPDAIYNRKRRPSRIRHLVSLNCDLRLLRHPEFGDHLGSFPICFHISWPKEFIQAQLRFFHRLGNLYVHRHIDCRYFLLAIASGG